MSTHPRSTVLALLLMSLAAPALGQEVAPAVAPAAASAEVPALLAPELPAKQVVIGQTPALGPDGVQGLHPKRVGFATPAPLEVNAALTWTLSRTNQWICHVEITSPGAAGLRIGIGPSDARPNVAVRMYNPVTGEVFPPEWPTQFGEPAGWWSPVVFAETVGVELSCPRLIGEKENTPPPPPRITSLGCYQREFVLRELGCQIDVACEPVWAVARNGVVKLTYMRPDNLFYFCSGSILNRSPNDFCPLLLTARHCIDGDFEAQTLRAIFNFQSTSCDSGIGGSQSNQVGPGFLLRGIATYDNSLVGLLQSTPGGTSYLGWTTNSWPLNSFTAGIHHPGGTYKRRWDGAYSGSGIRTFTGSGDVSVWFADISTGSVEPGSSGSPLFDNSANQFIHGVLTGGIAACGGMQAYYGRFDLAFSSFDQFLTSVPSSVWLSTTGTFGDRGTTPQRPFGSIYEAYFCVTSGGTVNIFSGNYHDRPTFTRPMTLNAIGGPVTFGN